jgi:hypothetical protein
MSTLPLPSQTLAWLNHAADAGQRDAQALLHLIARADAQGQWFTKFTDSYSRTIAALCRRLESLERGANLQRRDEDAEATESGSVADTAQRITDYAAKAGLTVQDWAKAFNAAPVDDSPVANALRAASASRRAEPEGEGPSLQWTDNMPPSEACRYDHCTAETPFGRFLITWKSWKEYDDPTVDETPWGDWYAAFNSVDDAKAACQQGMNERLTRCGTPATPQAPEPVAWCRSDEFANSMNRGGSFSGWKDPGAGANKCDMQLYAIPLPAPQAGEVEA